jgi:hypothetical protein
MIQRFLKPQQLTLHSCNLPIGRKSISVSASIALLNPLSGSQPRRDGSSMEFDRKLLKQAAVMTELSVTWMNSKRKMHMGCDCDGKGREQVKWLTCC